MKHEKIKIKTPFIKLDSFLKYCGEAETGGTAKDLIKSGKIKLNGEICEVRGKKLVKNDIVTIGNSIYEVLSGEG